MTQSFYACHKCDINAKDHTLITEGGVGYLFCEKCCDLLQNEHKGLIKNFLPQRAETRIDKNMRLAREARARGESLWINK
jgi:hypothetical protein